MAEQASDSFFDVEFNGDQTQVFATIHPPRGTGRPITVEEVASRLRQMGVVYGFRESEIGRAIAQVASTNAPVSRVLVAQGELPVEGVDAQVNWTIDEDAACQPLPRDSCGAPDFFRVPAGRIVSAGQRIAKVIPSTPGSAGKSLTAPYRVIPVPAPRGVPFSAMSGVKFSEENSEYVAEIDGILEIKNNLILVHPVQWLEESLNNVTREFSTGVAIRGDLTACAIRAAGPIAVSGTVAGCTLRARGDVVVNRCARSKVVADGDVYVLGKLLHSHVVTPKHFISQLGSQVMGGQISATLGIQLGDAGGADGSGTQLVTAIDRFTAIRQQEVDSEISSYDENIQKIASVLRPLSAGSHEALPEQKRALIQTLAAQRRGLEERVRELHNEKRRLILASKSRIDAEVRVEGTIYRGVTVFIEAAARSIDETANAVRFDLNDFRDAVQVHSLEEALAA